MASRAGRERAPRRSTEGERGPSSSPPEEEAGWDENRQRRRETPVKKKKPEGDVGDLRAAGKAEREKRVSGRNWRQFDDVDDDE